MSGNELGKRVQRFDQLSRSFSNFSGVDGVQGHRVTAFAARESLREEETRVSSRIGANDPPATFRNQDSIHMGNPISDAKVELPVWVNTLYASIWEQLKVAPERIGARQKSASQI